MRQKAGEWLKKEKRKMNYTEKTKPGMGDPYWYEWSVGEQQIINMLNEENNIEYVELQANIGLGLDDGKRLNLG